MTSVRVDWRAFICKKRKALNWKMKGQDGPSFCWKVNINSEAGWGDEPRKRGKGRPAQIFLNATSHIHFCRATQHTGPPRQPQPFTAVFGSNSLHHVDDGDLTSSELMYDLYQSSYELQSDGHTLKSRRVACLKIQLCIHPQATSQLATMSPLARRIIHKIHQVYVSYWPAQSCWLWLLQPSGLYGGVCTSDLGGIPHLCPKERAGKTATEREADIERM